jgi:hypothetical protein
MRFKPTVVATAIACAILLLLGAANKWPYALFYCEGFGCSVMGVAYLIYASVIVVAFVIGGAGFGPKPRGTSALFAGGSAALAMFTALAFLYVQNKR